MQYQATLYKPRTVGEVREKIASWRINASDLKEAVLFTVKPLKADTTKGPDIIWPQTGELDVVPIIP